MARIFGKDGYQRLLLGREININDIKTRTCTIAKTDTSSNAVTGVMGGSKLYQDIRRMLQLHQEVLKFRQSMD